MNPVRIGIIGMGNMGMAHAKSLREGKVQRAELTAVSDTDPTRLDQSGKQQVFADPLQLIQSGVVDAVIIATPHFSHPALGIAALRRGLHVLVEKPLAVHKTDCQRLLAAHQNPRQKFAVMFQLRTEPAYRQIKQLITSGDLGEIRRINWIITNWFRTQAYFDSGGWRATWAGEGGGVLLNQCPHNLDLWQWLFGMPARVRAFCRLGRYHDIEVEDDVTACFEYATGTTGVFITSTGEAPGTNRLEIAAERGKLVLEGGRLTFIRNAVPMSEFSRTSTELFATPPATEVLLPIHGTAGLHVEMLQNFIDAILDDVPLIVPAGEGANSVELANAMLLSSQKGRTIELPMNAGVYARMLKDLMKTSRFGQKVFRAQVATDLTQSFNR